MDSVYPNASDKEETIMKNCEKADNNRPLDMEALTLEQVEKANGGVGFNTSGFNGCNCNSADFRGSHGHSDGIK